MANLNPYLTFKDTCAEAMRRYQHILGGQLEVMTVADSPMKSDLPPEMHPQVMHACLTLDSGMQLMASDACGQPFDGARGMSAALHFDTVEEAQRVFDALAEGGQASMPFGKTFWSEGFGMLTDRYGTPWMVNVIRQG